MMLTYAGLQLPGRTANIFCSTTADKRVHNHILTVDRQLVLEIEVISGLVVDIDFRVAAGNARWSEL